MIELIKDIELDIPYIFPPCYKIEDIVFFDIETTGFSAKTTKLYLIGCLYYDTSGFHIKQWFANDENSEYEILVSFFEFLNSFKLLIHFNGQGFDIPYLLNKCLTFNLPYNFDDIDNLDIYKQIKPIKHLLKLNNLKLKSIEHFLNIQRNDIYSGKELINVYESYILEPSDKKFNTLTIHNYDDLIGMTQILPILYYVDLFNHVANHITFHIVEDYNFVIKLTFPFEIPKRISYAFDHIYLTANKNSLSLNIKIYTGELKFFYSNYKDYYYLPIEDAAIHKSVAFYVDKEFRTKAKAANCYSRKSGRFLPQYSEIIEPFFKIEFFDKIFYFELTDECLNNHQLLEQYATHLIKVLIGRKGHIKQ